MQSDKNDGKHTMKEQYKHLLNFCANLVMLLVQGALFSFIWYRYYATGGYLFYRRGHWAAIGIYVLMIFFFTKTLNGYKIGYLRIMDICLSHILSILFLMTPVIIVNLQPPHITQGIILFIVAQSAQIVNVSTADFLIILPRDYKSNLGKTIGYCVF